MAEHAEGLVRIAAAFVRRKVNFVAIGGWAVQAQGFDLGYETDDIDFTPDLGPDNLERIVEALEDLEAQTKYRGLVLDVLPDAQGLARTPVWTMTCPHGKFDLVFDPAGLDGYHQLLPTAHPVSVNADGQRITVLCADLADIVKSKQAANREKDLGVLPLLRTQIAELQQQQLPRDDISRPDTGFGIDL